MSLPLYVNSNNYPVGLPTSGGIDVSVDPEHYVQGSYYQRFADVGLLTLYTGPAPHSWDIMATYDIGPIGGGGGTPVLTIDATAPIVATTVGDNVTVGLSPISASNIASGQVVKSLNTLTDAVILAAGAGVSVTPSGQTLTVTNTLPGPTSVSGVLPITASVDLAGALEVSIAITPQIAGGAVALQTGTPYIQEGFAGLNYLVLRAGLNQANVLLNYSSSDVFTSSIDSDGSFYGTSFFGTTGAFGSIELLSSVLYDGVTYTLGDHLLNFDSLGTSFIDLPFELKDTITLEASSLTAGHFGSIVGSQGASYAHSFIDLTAHLDNPIPLIKLTSAYASGVANDNAFLEVVDSLGIPIISLYGDGIVSVTHLETESLTATDAAITNLAVSGSLTTPPAIITAGARTLDISDPSVWACDCTAGPVTFELPALADARNGQTFTFVKTDLTTNNVLVAPLLGELLNGVASKLVTLQWDKLKVIAVKSISSSFWMTL